MNERKELDEHLAALLGVYCVGAHGGCVADDYCPPCMASHRLAKGVSTPTREAIAAAIVNMSLLEFAEWTANGTTYPNCYQSEIDLAYARADRVFAALSLPAEPEPVEGYRQAFYQLAELMGLSAQPVSPAEVWEGQMLPRLKAMFKTELVDVTQIPRLPRDKLLYGSPDYLDDPDGLARWRESASRGRGHDMVEGMNKNSMRRLLDTIERLRAALTAQRGLTLAKEGVGEDALRALTAARRNVYQLQMGGDRLCGALRKISVGTDAEVMVQIAKKALGHKEPEPDWRKIDVTARAALAGGKTEGGA